MRYEYADRAIRDMNRRNLRAFGKLRMLKSDELNVLRSVREVYETSLKIAKQRYLEVAYDAFFEALLLAGLDEKEARKLASKRITDQWVARFLSELDPITQYAFDPEVERKIHRTAEAILSAPDPDNAIDRALRLWTLQLSHYFIKIVDEVTEEGYEIGGVDYVRWDAEEDSKTCAVCESLDGNIYEIGSVPLKPHYNCRCWITPV